jgi:acyl carrier protein
MNSLGETVLRVERFVQKRINDPGARIRDLANSFQPQAENEASAGMTPSEGAEALARILAAEIQPQVVVSPNDLYAAMAESDEEIAHRFMTAAGRAHPDAASSGLGTPADEGFSPEVIERQIAAIWSEVLGLEGVGRADNFFENGGDSLAGIQLLSRIEKVFGVAVAVDVLFRTPTVEALSAAVLEQLVAQIAELDDSAALRRLASTMEERAPEQAGAAG